MRRDWHCLTSHSRGLLHRNEPILVYLVLVDRSSRGKTWSYIVCCCWILHIREVSILMVRGGMGVFYLCLHTVGLVRMEVVWVCFFVFTYRGFGYDGGGVGVFYLCLHTVDLVRMEVVWVCFICVYIPWVWLGWRWCGCVLFVFTYREFG